MTIFDGRIALAKQIGEDEVIAEFLRAEFNSERAGPSLRQAAEDFGVGSRVIIDPDFDSKEEREARRQLAERYAGWGADHGVCGGLPTETVTWWLAYLDREVIGAVEVIRWLVEEFPDQFPARGLGGLRGARLRKRGRGQPPEAVRLTQALAEGSLARPVVITTPDLQRLVVLEGHNRLFAYALLGTDCPAQIDLILGVTPVAHRWSEW